MRTWTILLGYGLLATISAGAALAQPVPPAAAPPTPAQNAPPPPGRGACTEARPCRSALNEAFYYTPSGDRRYLTRR
jgi:hypothetical protein